jgi:hypothetical protein
MSKLTFSSEGTKESKKMTLTEDEFGRKIAKAILEAIQAEGHEEKWNRFSLKIEFAARRGIFDELALAHLVITPLKQEENVEPTFMRELQNL